MSEMVRYEQDLSLSQLGTTFAKSGFFKDAKDAAQAVVKILAGQELGLGPVASMRSIDIVEGKVALTAGLMAAMIKRSAKYDYRIRARTDKECSIAFFENGEEVGVSTFTLADATRAGLAGRPTWKAYPGNMLFNRAMANGFRAYTPDLAMGPIYAEGEIEEGFLDGGPARGPAVAALPEPAVEPEKDLTRRIEEVRRQKEAEAKEAARAPEPEQEAEQADLLAEPPQESLPQKPPPKVRFIERARALRESLHERVGEETGDEVYYAILHAHNLQHSNEIDGRATGEMRAIVAELEAATTDYEEEDPALTQALDGE